MDNVQECAVAALDDVQGDFIEAGRVAGRSIDSHAWNPRCKSARYGSPHYFTGVPPPNPGRYTVDAPRVYHEYDWLTVPLLRTYEENVDRYGLLDQRVECVEGWFKDTPPQLERKSAMIRLDSDLYESTIDAISALYPSLSPASMSE